MWERTPREQYIGYAIRPKTLVRALFPTWVHTLFSSIGKSDIPEMSSRATPRIRRTGRRNFAFRRQATKYKRGSKHAQGLPTGALLAEQLAITSENGDGATPLIVCGRRDELKSQMADN